MPPRVLSVGEALWDLLPQGPQPGGAPANLAVHARSLGAEARLVSRVGDDSRGRELVERLGAQGVDAGLIGVDPELPTGTVSVTVGEDGQPGYVIHEPAAWDALPGDAASLDAARETDAVCFGSLAQRRPASRAAVRALVAAAPASALRLFDVNLRQAFHTPETIEASLGLANALKLNDAELPVLTRLLGLRGDGERARIEALAERFGLRLVAFTRGARGSLLRVDGAWSEQPSLPVAVRDTVGAGDAFAAAVVVGVLSGQPLAALHRRAAEVAAYVCSRPGPTPPLPLRLTAAPGEP